MGIDTCAPRQIEGQVAAIRKVLQRFPAVRRIVGHRDLAATLCPAYDVAAPWAGVQGCAVSMPVPAPAPVQTRCFLKRGSRGLEVRASQGRLARLGLDAALIDDDFGPLTEWAYRRAWKTGGRREAPQPPSSP